METISKAGAVSPFTLIAQDGVEVTAYRALPDGPSRGLVQIAHGIAEHFGRYRHLTDRLTAAGYTVYGVDHRGHGRSTGSAGLGHFGSPGFQAVVDDMASLSRLAKGEQPGQPLILLAHSMGSFAAQLYLLEHASELSGLVLSGTAALDLLLGALLAGGGPVTLEVLNKGFEPGRTPYDWISSDPAQVDAYIADPLSGFDVPEETLQSIFGLTAMATLDPRVANLPQDLPIYVISGQFDPVVGPDQTYSTALVDRYRAAGVRRVDHRIYPGGRHEMFNEINRDTVETELIDWLNAITA
ncbi:alpha/beta hydrolase [soil metagenome]